MNHVRGRNALEEKPVCGLNIEKGVPSRANFLTLLESDFDF